MESLVCTLHPLQLSHFHLHRDDEEEEEKDDDDDDDEEEEDVEDDDDERMIDTRSCTQGRLSVHPGSQTRSDCNLVIRIVVREKKTGLCGKNSQTEGGGLTQTHFLMSI